jgi:hypothetical protein
MIIRNGKSDFGWRLDDLSSGKAGIAMLMAPFAIVPDEKDADRIVKAFEVLPELRDALQWAYDQLACVNGRDVKAGAGFQEFTIHFDNLKMVDCKGALEKVEGLVGK